MGGKHYFFVYESSMFGSKTTLWVSNGTEDGTLEVRSVCVGQGECAVLRNSLVVQKNQDSLYFLERSIDGLKLWKSDGTTLGTKVVKILSVPSTTYVKEYDSFINIYASTNNIYMLFDWHLDDEAGELWISDGSESGTKKLRDFGSIYVNNPEVVATVGSLLYFVAEDSSSGHWLANNKELWVTDGTLAGTKMVKDIRPDTVGSNIYGLRSNAYGIVYFTANDGVHGTELWKSDGTEDGTVMVKDISAGDIDTSYNGGIYNITRVGNIMYFSTYEINDDHTVTVYLWKTNGTKNGTQIIKTLSSHIYGFTNVNGSLYFRELEDGRLWSSNGTNSSTNKISGAILSGEPAPFYSYKGILNGKLYFSGSDGIKGNEIYQISSIIFQGNSTKFVNILKDMNPGSEDGFPWEPVVVE